MPEFLTVEDVAALLQCSRRTVLNMIERRRFPGARKLDPGSLRSTWRIPASDVAEYQHQQQSGPVNHAQA